MTERALPSWQIELKKAAEKAKINFTDLLLGYCILKGDISPIKSVVLEFKEWIDFYYAYVNIKPGLNKQELKWEIIQTKILEQIYDLDVNVGKCYESAKQISEASPETLRLKAVLLKKMAREFSKE